MNLPPFDDRLLFNGRKGAGQIRNMSPLTDSSNSNATPKAGTNRRLEVQLLENMDILLQKIPMPENTLRNLSLRGVSMAKYFDEALQSNPIYGGQAVKVYQLIRHMKWYVCV
jgi:hypothetical protein